MSAAAIVVPGFNEADHLNTMLDRLLGVTQCEPCLGSVIVVDDGSTDGSRELLSRWSDAADVVIRLHVANRGKGAAIRTGLAEVTADWIVIQDAGLGRGSGATDSEVGPNRMLMLSIVFVRVDFFWATIQSRANRSDWWSQWVSICSLLSVSPIIFTSSCDRVPASSKSGSVKKSLDDSASLAPQKKCSDLAKSSL